MLLLSNIVKFIQFKTTLTEVVCIVGYTFFYKKPLYRQPSTRQPRIYETFGTTGKGPECCGRIAH